MSGRTQTFTRLLLTGVLLTACQDESHVATEAPLFAANHARHANGLHPAGIAVASIPDYARITAASASETRGSIELTVMPAARPPRRVEEVFGGNAVFGYAWVDLDTGAGIAATIHPSFRDSRQNPAGWHTHVIQLAAGAGAADLCLVSASAHSPGGIAIRPDEVRVSMSRQHAGLSVSVLDAAAAFFVTGEPDCATGLGVHLSDDPVPL